MDYNSWHTHNSNVSNTTQIMDNKLEFVLNTFKIDRNVLFSKSRIREIADARALLYALYHEGNLYGTSKIIKERYDWNMSRSGIKNGVKHATKFFHKEIQQFREDEIRRRRKF